MTDYIHYIPYDRILSWDECDAILLGSLPDPCRYRHPGSLDWNLWEDIWYGKAAETVGKAADCRLESVALLAFAMLDCSISHSARRDCALALERMSRESLSIIAYVLTFCRDANCRELGAGLLADTQPALALHRALSCASYGDCSLLWEVGPCLVEANPGAAHLIAEGLQGFSAESVRSFCANFFAAHPMAASAVSSLPPLEAGGTSGMLLEMACMSPSPAVRLQAAKTVLGTDLATDLSMAVIGALEQTGTAEIRTLATEQLASRSLELHRRFSERHLRLVTKEQACRIRAFKRGVICPTEMWLSLFENLAAGDVAAFLDGLDNDLQAVILEEYQGFASYRFSPSWYEQYPIPMQDTITAIKEWCRTKLAS